MRSFITTLVCLSTFVFAFPYTKRGLPVILNDLSLVSSNFTAFNAAINAYTGFSNQTNQTSSIQSTFVAVEGILKSSLADVSNSTTFNEADSEAIAHSVTALAPLVIHCLVDVIAKYPVVNAAAAVPAVHGALTILMTGVDGLLTALTDKVTEEQTAPIGTAADQINYAFKITIDHYRG